MTEEELESRLDEAGGTLLILRVPGLWPSQRVVARLPIIDDWQAYGWTEVRPRMPTPSPAEIDRLDEVMGWINAYLPLRPVTERKIIHGRMLVHPLTGVRLMKWAALGRQLGADPRAVRRWHRGALKKIIQGLAETVRKVA